MKILQLIDSWDEKVEFKRFLIRPVLAGGSALDPNEQACLDMNGARDASFQSAIQKY